MKKTLIFSSLLCFTFFSNGQILKKIADRAKQRAEAKTNEKVETKVDKTVDSAFSKTEKTVTDAVKGNPGNKSKNEVAEQEDTTATNDESSGKIPSIKTYSKYDFVPGEKIVVYEDFMQDAIGDFPDKWNTNSSGEVVTLEGIPGHWFMLTKHGYFVPEFIDSFPENFTLEFDLLCDLPVTSWGLHTSFLELADRNKPEAWQSTNNSFTINILPGADGNGYSDMDRRKAGTGEAATRSTTHQFADITKPVHVVFWRQKERMRVYFNEEKAWDIPKAILPGVKLNTLLFWVQLTDDKSHFIMSNLRVATGAPDTRNKMLTQNKWVTHGILFDVNSANIKPQSYGTLKEMANVLKENPDLKVMIVGHTDADGKDDANLDLSKRRAAAVKTMLAKEFSIDESRMETDGKGESEPIDKNDNPAGKANNRRVEFIKL